MDLTYVIYLGIISLLVCILIAFYNFIDWYRKRSYTEKVSNFEETLSNVNILIIGRDIKKGQYYVHCNEYFISLDDKRNIAVCNKFKSVDYLDTQVIHAKLINIYKKEFKIIYVFSSSTKK